jgi:hypothetical protein
MKQKSNTVIVRFGEDIIVKNHFIGQDFGVSM